MAESETFMTDRGEGFIREDSRVHLFRTKVSSYLGHEVPNEGKVKTFRYHGLSRQT